MCHYTLHLHKDSPKMIYFGFELKIKDIKKCFFSDLLSLWVTIFGLKLLLLVLMAIKQQNIGIEKG